MKKLISLYEEVIKIRYDVEHLDSYDGQNNYELGMYIGDEIIGMVQYVIYNNELTISDIVVKPKYRRKGFGSRMVQYIKNYHPDATYRESMKTDLGTKFKHKKIDGDLKKIEKKLAY